MTEQQKKLVEENEKLIYSFAHMYKLNVDDWYGILAIVLCNASFIYDDSKGKFSTLFYCLARQRFLNEIQTNSRFKRNHGQRVPFYEADVMCTDRRFEERELLQSYKEVLTEEEFGIIMLKYEGYTQSEIAIMMNTTQSNISSKLIKIREKIS